MEAADILFIEDNQNDIELTLRALNKINVSNKIHTIEDGEEAMEYINCTGQYANRNKLQNPKVILLDLKLPKVSGLEILKRIKSNYRTKFIPVIILTSSREESDLIRSYKYGVNSYVVKPINFKNFNNAIESIGLYWLGLNEYI